MKVANSQVHIEKEINKKSQENSDKEDTASWTSSTRY